jgi:hypothetical protein
LADPLIKVMAFVDVSKGPKYRIDCAFLNLLVSSRQNIPTSEPNPKRDPS